VPDERLELSAGHDAEILRNVAFASIEAPAKPNVSFITFGNRYRPLAGPKSTNRARSILQWRSHSGKMGEDEPSV
jgi:hypothetical protein